MSATILSGPRAALAPRRALPALRLVQTPRGPRWLARWLVVLLALLVAAMGLAPWQQTAVGTGRVAAFAPLERQQTVKAPVSGVVAEWNDHIVEGVQVKQGEKILEIRDNDPQYLERLREQLEATRRKLEASHEKADIYQQQVEAFIDAQRLTIEAGEQQVEAARAKVRAEEQALEAAAAAELQARLNYDRQKQLFEDGLASKLTFELEERKFAEAKAKQKQAQNYLEAAISELKTKDAELIGKGREADAKVQSARALFQTAVGDVAVVEKELLELSTKIAQQQTQTVTAPRDGTILRLLVQQGGEIVSKGDPLFILVPESASRAVELWVDGNDAPLITPGRQVRLQFEGWPAVQFAGWPSVAVGTFGGEVATVDATDDGKGKFRVLVVPTAGEDWPSDRFLRQGVRANGWVLLSQVRLGYEVWRRINGFPPVVSMDEPGDGASGGKSKQDAKKK
jgi:membrane fusion protein, adhesin transport system